MCITGGEVPMPTIEPNSEDHTGTKHFGKLKNTNDSTFKANKFVVIALDLQGFEQTVNLLRCVLSWTSYPKISVEKAPSIQLSTTFYFC